jgi:hypothetical protein
VADPRISVLLPLQDEREAGVSGVRAWLDQTLRPEDFELVVLPSGEDVELERQIRPLLRPGDQWVDEGPAEEYELMNIGARHARGSYVFLTELHCIPHRDCLAAMLDELERTGAAGVRGDSIDDVRGPLGALEHEQFDGPQRAEEDPEHWRKVLIHTFAMRRDLYLELGGLPPAYGDFAPWILAIRLNERGERPVFSPRPKVNHVYDGDLRKLGGYVRNFMRGEARYRGAEPDLARRYLAPATEWEDQLRYTRAGALRGARAALSLRDRSHWREALGHAAVATLGVRASIMRARMRSSFAARRARRAIHDGERSRSFVEFWQSAIWAGRLEGLGSTNGRRPGPARPADGRIDLGETLAGSVIGSYAPDPAGDGAAVRWTGPLCLLHVQVPGSGSALARLELWPNSRPPEIPARTRVAIDNRLVPISAADDALEFEIEAGDRWITIGCTPWVPAAYGLEDPRPLGLPLRAISFEAGPSRPG